MTFLGRFAGKVAVVTGAGGTMGAAVVRVLLEDGCRVGLVDLAPESMRALEAEFGGSVCAVACDIADPAAVAAAHVQVVQRLGPVDVLVNNAGVLSNNKLEATSVAEWRRVLGANLDGALFWAQAVVPSMKARRWGRIVNLSSIASLTGNRGQVNYAAAKGALNSATKSLALELASRGITVNAVAPGIIGSGMAEAAFDAAMIDKLVPMKRAGRAEEVAALVAFLVSDDAGYISGQVISINGAMI